MSVSVHPFPLVKPVHSFDFGSRMDSAASKFTAVNGSASLKDTPKSFTFRPDPTASFAQKSTPEPDGRAPNASNDRVAEPQASQQTPALSDNSTIAKRKRTPEQKEGDRSERNPSAGIESPLKIHKVLHADDQPVSVTGRQSPAAMELDGDDSRSWTDTSQQGNTQGTSPDDQLAESLRREVARHDSTAGHSSDSQQGYDPMDRAGGKSKQPKRIEDTLRETKKRAFTHRTKTGCMTCRKRKKKCDEHKPICLNCTKGSFKCEGYEEDKVVANAAMANGRARSGTHGSATSNLAPYPVSRPGWSEYESGYRGQSSPESRRTSDNFGAGQRIGWGKPIWAQDGPPSAMQAAKDGHPPTASRLESPRAEPFFNMSREQQRLAHESLVNTARLGTSIAPALSPSEIKATTPGAAPTSVPGPPLAPITHAHTLPLVNTSPQSRSSPPSHNVPIAHLSPLTHHSPIDMSRMRQRQRMLQGLPYHHWNDAQLIDDRNDCKAALERYNKAVRQSQGTSEEECGRLFKAVVMPELRRQMPSEGRPSGSLGRFVQLEAPFHCEYGYNIHIDDDVIIDANCYIQDPCPITIGKRTVIGPNVQFYGRVLPTDPRARGSLRGLAVGAPITIEEDVSIGGGCIINAGVRIGRGSVILPGSVVDKDVPSGVECCGNPFKIIRGISLPADNNINHDPRRYDLNDMASLMMKERGPAFSNMHAR